MVWYDPTSWFEDEVAPPDASGTGQVLRAHDLNDKDPQKKAAARKAFQDNYSNLYRQMDDKWREVLKEMASNATGQSIIANIPPNVKVNGDASLEGATGAAYVNSSNTFEFGKINADGKTGADGSMDPYMCLVHEARHAMQDHLGYSMWAGNRSLKEAAINGMLIEADAFSVANVETIIRDSFGSTRPTPEQIKAFMKKDLLYEDLSLFPENERKEQLNLRKNGSDYRLQQALIKNGGDLNKARLEMRSHEFKGYWEKGRLNTQYDHQTLNNILWLMDKGVKPGKGDEKQANQIYEQIAKANGVSVEEVKKNLKVSPAFQKSIDYIHEHPNENTGDLRKAISKIYDEFEKKHDTDKNGIISDAEYNNASQLFASDRKEEAKPIAQAEQSSGGFGSWFRNSWFGRLIGVNDQPQEPVAPAQPAEQNQALASGAETRGQAQPAQTVEVNRGPSDATRTLASAGQRYQEQRDVSQYQRGAGRDA